MAKIQPPYFGLARCGREWVPVVVFTASRDRAEFLRLADWLCREFHAQVVKRHGGEGTDDKEILDAPGRGLGLAADAVLLPARDLPRQQLPPRPAGVREDRGGRGGRARRLAVPLGSVPPPAGPPNSCLTGRPGCIGSREPAEAGFPPRQERL